ncbi:MAG TPA: hypothetical protein VGN80_10975 [Devosiaceae bacterium]|jgi:hypothetical protein|nr:hypothetical protein [Devosiaceae bacterium]
MDLQEQIRQAMLAELQRQASERPQELTVKSADGRVEINGTVDLDDLVMVAVSSVAGGP